MHVNKRLAEEMNATTAPQYPSDSNVARLIKELLDRNVDHIAFERAINSPEICDQLADIMRIIRVPKTDLSSPLNEAAVKRVVNYLFNFDVKRTKSFDEGKPWYAKTSTGYDPVWLYEDANFRKLLEGMDSDYLTILVLRKGLLSGDEVPAGVLAERFKVPAKDISTMLQRANKHMKSRQLELFPFFRKRKFPYEYLYTNAALLQYRLITEEFSSTRDGFHIHGARERVLDAGITTIGELVALPRRQAAELLLGDDVYLPLKWFPRYVHVS